MHKLAVDRRFYRFEVSSLIGESARSHMKKKRYTSWAACSKRSMEMARRPQCISVHHVTQILLIVGILYRVSWHPNFRVPVRGRLLPFRSGLDHPYELPCTESLFFTPLFWCLLPQELYLFWRPSNVIIRTTLRTHICSCSRYRCFHQCRIELGVLTWCRCHNLSRVQTVFQSKTCQGQNGEYVFAVLVFICLLWIYDIL